MISYKHLFLAMFALTIFASSVQASTTYISIKTDVPYYDIAIRQINYANEEPLGSTYLKTDYIGYAEGNFSSEEEKLKLTIIIYRDGVIYKQYDNYGTYKTGGTIALDLRENKDTNITNSTNSTTSENNQSNSTINLTTTTSTTGNAISEPSTSKEQSTNFVSSLWMYIAAGIILVGAAGFLGVRYVQQRGTMSGMAKYDKAQGPIEEKPLFQSEFQPVSEKMDDVATQQELRKARDRIRNLERELTMARNADKIREAEKRIEEEKKRLDRLRRGENV